MLSLIFYYLSIFSPLLPITVGIRKWRSLLWFYAVAGFFFDLIYMLLIKYYYPVKPNLSVAGNIFIAFEFILIALYYRNRLFVKRPLFYIITGFIILVYVFSLSKKENTTFNFIGGSLFDVTCIAFAVSGFYSLLKGRRILFLERSQFFWVNVAILTYCTGNFLVFLFGEYLTVQNDDLFHDLWIFHNVLNIIFSILIAISFLKRVREP